MSIEVRTERLKSLQGSGREKTLSATPKTTVTALMPRANAQMATREKRR